jgi:AraC family transcriptional regulator
MRLELLDVDTSKTAPRLGPSLSELPAVSTSPLLAIAPGPSRILHSSAGLPWHGFLLEKHLSSPGERRSTSINRHIIMLLRGTPARFEYRTPTGRWANFVNRPNTLTIMPAGRIPDVRLHTLAELCYCALEDSFIRGVANELDHAPKTSQSFCSGLSNDAIQRILGLLLDELESRGSLGRLYVDALAHALASRYLLLEGTSELWSESHTSALPARILNRVREKIEANLHTDLSLECLARESGYSRAHFLRMFRVATGVTPHQYILDARLRQAQACLRRKDTSLIDIAAVCGFSSQSHMTSVFRKRFQMTPAEYRRNAW